MPISDSFLRDLAMVLITAAVVAVVFRRLKLPTVLGYLLAGMVVGPNVPLPLFANVESVRGLAELGVTLLMFSIGLEFSVSKLLQLGRSSLFITAIEVALLFWLGFLSASAVGFSSHMASCVGALAAIASTMVVAKSMNERRVDPEVREFVLGILVVEDVASMLLLALLTATLAGSDLTAAQFAGSSLKLVAFLAALLLIGMALVPRLLRWVLATGDREVILLAAVGVCFLFSLLAKRAGYSIALGAFIAGTVVAEAGHGRILEPLVRPVRDVFAAVFFVAVGMLIEPELVLEHLPLAALLVVVIVVGKVCGVTLGGALTGAGVGPSVRSALWLVPVAEYQFLVAEVARQSDVGGGELHAIAAAVSVLTVLIAPFLTTRSDAIATAIENRLPDRFAVFETLYGSWIDTLRRRQLGKERKQLMRLLLWLVIDAAMALGLVVAVSVWRVELAELLSDTAGISTRGARTIVFIVALLAWLPFGFGVLRASRRFAVLLSELALPWTGGADMAAAPRRALAATVQAGLLILVGMGALALAQPFLPSLGGVSVAILVAVVGWIAFRRRVDDLDGHFRAGSQVVLEALVLQSRAAAPLPSPAGLPQPASTPMLEQVSALLPGLGTITAVTLAEGSIAVGQTLEDLDLHGHTGATVVCVARGGRGWTSAQQDQPLEQGDVLAITGTDDEIEHATQHLATSV